MRIFLAQTIGMRAVVFFEKCSICLNVVNVKKDMENIKSISKISVKTSILLWMKLRKNIILKIRPFSQKYCAFLEFFKFGIKTPCRLTHNWSTKRQIWQNYAILWAKNPIGCPLSHFSRHFIASTCFN